VKPEQLAERIAAARRGAAAPQALPAAANAAPPLSDKPSAAKSYPVAPAVYEQASDSTQNRAASAQEELPNAGDEAAPADELPPAAAPLEPIADDAVAAEGSSEAQRLYSLGEEALRNRDTQRALEHFRQAFELRDQLDPNTAQR